MSVKTTTHLILYLWTAVIAAVTVITGFLSLGTGLGIVSGLPVPPDIAGGCILLLLGALFITGLVEGSRYPARWVQYGYTGMLLLLIFGLCSVLISGADILTRIIGGEFAFLTPFPLSGFVWGAVLALPAFLKVRRILTGCPCHGDSGE